MLHVGHRLMYRSLILQQKYSSEKIKNIKKKFENTMNVDMCRIKPLEGIDERMEELEEMGIERGLYRLLIIPFAYIQYKDTPFNLIS